MVLQARRSPRQISLRIRLRAAFGHEELTLWHKRRIDDMRTELSLVARHTNWQGRNCRHRPSVLVQLDEPANVTEPGVPLEDGVEPSAERGRDAFLMVLALPGNSCNRAISGKERL
jgi:hypothetical protein